MTANNDSDYEIPKVEKHLIHVLAGTPQFNQQTGADEGVMSLQSFYPKVFERMEKEGAFAGQKVMIIHDPTNEAEDISPLDALKPKTVNTGAGGGIPLTKAVQNMKVAELKAIYKSVFPEADDNEIKDFKKENFVQEIGDRIAYLTDERATGEFEQLERTRLNGLGFILTEDAKK